MGMKDKLDIPQFFESFQQITSVLANNVQSLEIGEQKQKFMDMYDYCKLMFVSMCDEPQNQKIFLYGSENGLGEKCERSTISM